MRSADIATLARTALAVFIVYLIIIKFNAFVTVFLIAVVMFLDAFDGYLAINEESKGKISFLQYSKALLGEKKSLSAVKQVRERVSKNAKHGPRMDVAGDRVVEYLFWIVFTYLKVIPLFIIVLIVIRHSFADALMAAKGTSSKMKSKFAQLVYSSNTGRSGINVAKFLAFSYLILMYVNNYPAIVGYVLVAILVVYIMLRGMAEIYESLSG